MRFLSSLSAMALAVAATPAAAASGPFFSMNNTNFVVLIAFVLFVAVLLYLKVPGMVTGILDTRAEAIRKDLDEARSLREQAQTILATYERKQKEVAEHAGKIVEHAKAEAAAAAVSAKADLKASITRRLAAAEEQIASAEAGALREVRDRAVSLAIAAAGEVIARSMSAKDNGDLIDAAIADAGKKLH
ncbi:MAG: F0F1 ATP synthase subunit B [Rhodobacterales bacterium]|jgi:F-type H+-transporting ATPase subunit b|nr:F0F1 ATP synthase subunit B [Pseudomonadota bacterium]MDA1287663.1 F0F1 ATP synthase subunit B [Pseudomonadota bacterium]HBN31241.1 ATP F0F1 synthase subunit B [Paracoccaceae bacterium]